MAAKLTFRPISAEEVYELIRDARAARQSGKRMVTRLSDPPSSPLLSGLYVPGAEHLRDCSGTDDPDWLDKLLAGKRALLERLARLINNTADKRRTSSERPARLPTELARFNKALQDGQAAVNVLRRILPQLVEEIRADAERGPNALALSSEGESADEWKARLRRAADAYALMLATLLDLKPHRKWQPQAKRTGAEWHETAAYLFEGYRQFVGHGTLAKKGPAVRFVKAALERAECGERTENNIEQALRSYRKDQVRVPVDRDHGFRRKMITQSGGT